MRPAFVRAALLACLAGFAAYAQAEWKVTVLHPHPPELVRSGAAAVYGGVQAGWTFEELWQRTRAALWRGTADSWVDLHPPGVRHSVAVDVHGGVQVGHTVDTDLNRRAALWRGTAASHVDLHPVGAWHSGVAGVHGDTQVGSTVADGRYRAALWRSTAASHVSLHPPGAWHSVAAAVHGNLQAGYTLDADLRYRRAALWRGAAASYVSLHPPGAWESEALAVDGVVQAGSIRGGDGRWRAALWHGTAASHVCLHPPGAMSSTLTAVHGNWQAGWLLLADGRPRAGVWRGTADSWRELPLPPGTWGSSHASDVWKDSTTISVVGSASSGDRQVALLWVRPEPAPARVSGSLELGGWMGPLTDPLVTFEVRAPGSTTALQTAVVGLSATGDFSFTTALPPGTYDVTAKSDRWLRARLQNVTFTAAGASGLAFGELIPGDVVEDNAVDLADFLALAATYEVSPPAEARADLNGDGSVDLADFLLLAAHYESVGAP